MRILQPAPNVYAFYDGRPSEPAPRVDQTWVEQGALSLGIASYAILDGEQALVYDTHVSVGHAAELRRTLEEEGARSFTVLLSHWHLDHVAGTEAFADCEILARKPTLALLERHREKIESGTLEGPPAIAPLVMPTRTLPPRSRLRVGATELELIGTEIHSEDATVVWLPARRLLLAGDTVEDTVTYVMEPERLAVHLTNLELLRKLEPTRVLPNHGDEETIAGGGYGEGLIAATRDYTAALIEMVDRPELRRKSLREILAGPLRAGWITYFPPYEAVHQANLRSLFDARP
jgi:glyoxylase-like metal-dependent hydrolase (beta-lactamase superfamily II)